MVGSKSVGLAGGVLAFSLIWGGLGCSSGDGGGGSGGAATGGSSSQTSGGAATGGSSSQTSGGMSSGAGASNIGKACDTSTDCASGLSCHQDPVDYISHEQCSKECNADDECDKLEKGSFCIGAHVCVHPCASDKDCGSKTQCNDAGWCERGGPGSGVPSCDGTPSSCELQAGSNCLLTEGCKDNSTCSGAAESCSLQLDEFQCSEVKGCDWDIVLKECTGVSRSCTELTFDFDCMNQKGCTWSSSCTGTPEKCSTFPVSDCSIQPGCTVNQNN